MSYVAILMDCHMPGMDGFEVTRLIREREAVGARRNSIIAMTADALQGDRDRCLAAGMDDYVSKPIQLQTLGSVLAQWAAAPSEYAEPDAPPSAT